MSRLDRRRGRFSADFETTAIDSGLIDWQSEVGTEVEYYRFDGSRSVTNDIYDEGSGTGKAYREPVPLPVIHVIHDEGMNENLPEGFYSNDNVHATAAFEHIRRVGLTELDIQTSNYLSDRFVYDQKVFRVMQISVLGQIQDRDVIAAIQATQVKPDELVNDEQFAQYAS